MTRIYETLPPVGRLQMTLRVMSPTRLAQTFAAFVGQFYDRSAFDTLGRVFKMSKLRYGTRYFDRRTVGAAASTPATRAAGTWSPQQRPSTDRECHPLDQSNRSAVARSS